MAEINLRDKELAARRIGANPPAITDSTKTLFTDGTSPGKGDVGRLKNQPLAPKDTTDASIEASSPSKEYNVYNRLNHLEMICGYDVRYFITPTALTHAASIFRHIAFGDISEVIKKAQEFIADQKNKAQKAFEEAARISIKNQVSMPKDSINKFGDEVPPEYKYIDQFNIPWTLRVPKEGAKDLIKSLNASDVMTIDSQLASKGLVEDKAFPLSIEVEVGREMYNCPQKPMVKGGLYLGKITRPLFIPVKAGVAYGGIFGKWFTEAKKVIISKSSVIGTKLKSTSALAAARMVLPTKIDESENSALASLPILADFANIVNVPLFYTEKGNKDYVSYIDTRLEKPVTEGSTQVELDEDWKRAIWSGDLFYDVEETPQYSKTDLVPNTIVKHGTKNLTISDLDKSISEVKDKITSPILGRAAINQVSKTGNKPAEADDGSPKTLDQFSALKVREYIKEKDWQDVISSKLLNSPRWKGGIKSGSNIKAYSDLPSFFYWTPFVSYMGKESDGSFVYGYAEPSEDNYFNELQILYYETPPYAHLVFGAERKRWDSPGVYSPEDPSVFKENIAPFLDAEILTYGLGGYDEEKYSIPISSLLRNVSLSGISKIYDKNYKIGTSNFDIYKDILRRIAGSFGALNSDLSSNVSDNLSEGAYNSLLQRSASREFLSCSLNDLLLVATDNMTINSDSSLYIVRSDNTISFTRLKAIGKLILGSLKECKIHIGKEINKAAVSANASTSEIFIDASVKQTSLYNPEDNSFVIDIQPGEVIYSEDQSVRYTTDPFVPGSCIDEASLLSPEFKARPGIIEVVSSFVSPNVTASIKPESEPSKENISTRPVQQTKLKDIAFSFSVAKRILFGRSSLETLPSSRIELGDLLPSFYPDKITNSAGPFYVSNGGIFGDFMYSCITSDHFYVELVEDFKKSIAGLLGIAFTREDRSGEMVEIVTKTSQKVRGRVISEESGDIETITIEVVDQTNPSNILGKKKYSLSEIASIKKFVIPSTDSSIFSDTVKEYFTVSGNGLNFNPNPSSSSPALDYNYVPNNVSFIPWNGFLSGDGKVEEGSEHYKKFEIRDPKEFVGMFVNNINYSYSSVPVLINSILSQLNFSTGEGNPAKQFLGLALSNKEAFENFVAQGSNLSWVRGKMINEFGLSSSLVDVISSSFNDLLLSSIKSPLLFLLSKPNMISSFWGGSSVIGMQILYPLGSSIEDADSINAELINSIATKYNLLSNSSIFSIPELISIGDAVGVEYNGSQREKEALVVAVFCIAGIILDTILRNEKLRKLLKDGVDQYYLYASKLSSEDASIVPEYEVRSATPLLEFLKELSNSVLEGKTNDNGASLASAFSVSKFFLSSWTYPKGEKNIVPGDASIKIPVCLVESIEGTDEYSFIDHTKSYTYEQFVRNIEEGKWVFLFKVVKPKWLDGNLDPVRTIATHCAFTLQLLDMMGVVGQAVIENSRIVNTFEPIEKGTSEEDLKKIMRDKIIASSIYSKDKSSFFGSSSNEDTEYIVPLKDFTNMLKVSKDSSAGIKFTKMYPVVLKDLKSEDLKNGITLSSLVGKTSIDLSFMEDPTTNRMACIFLRPGYGFPDIVKGLGYRCVIKNFDSFARSLVENKRFAFHGKWKLDQASIFSDRMLQQAVGKDIWSKIVKSSEWTEKIKDDPKTVIGTSIFGMEVPPSYLSKFDNPRINGLSKTAILDIEFGYLSSRPVFAQVINIKAPKYSGEVQFIAKSVSDKINFYPNNPVNFSVALTEGAVQNKRIESNLETALNITKKLAQKNDQSLKHLNWLPAQLLQILSTSLYADSSNEGSRRLSFVLRNFSDTKVPGIERDIYFTAAFGVPAAYQKSDAEELTREIGNNHSYQDKKNKIVEMINSDKLRDVGFIKNSELTVTGKTYTDFLLRNGMYPYLPRGTKFRTLEGILNGTFDDYNSLLEGGSDHESIVDFHPLSFLTSMTNIGLSKRRAVLYGFAVLSKLLTSYKFYKDPNAVNPYAGIYVKSPGELSFSQEDVGILRQSGRKGFLKDGKPVSPSYISVVVIPDFGNIGEDIKTVFSSYLTGVTNIDENISEKSLFSFFGVGSYLGGEYVEKGQKPTILIPSDTSQSGDLSSYNSENVVLASNLLKKYYEAAKASKLYSSNNGGDDSSNTAIFLSISSGEVFPSNITRVEEIEKYISENSLSSVVIKLEIDQGSIKEFSRALDILKNEEDNRKNNRAYFFDASGGVVYYTVAILSYLKNVITIKKSDKNSGNKRNIDMLQFLFDLLSEAGGIFEYMDGSSCESDIDAVNEIDLYSLVSGAKMPSSPSSLPVRLSVLKEGKNETKVEQLFAIASKVYIGPSSTLDNKKIHVAVTNVSVGIGKNINGLTCTRSFGEGLTLCGDPESESNLLSSSLEEVPSFIPKRSPVLKTNSPGNENKPNNLLVTEKSDIHFSYLPGVNRILLAKAELKLRYLKDRYNDPAIKTYKSDSVRLSDLTLNELTYVPGEYFVKEIGGKLKSLFSGPGKDEKYCSFADLLGVEDSKRLAITKTFDSKKFMVATGHTFGKNDGTSKYYDIYATGEPLSILGVSLGGLKNSAYTSIEIDKDVEKFDKKVIAALWSLFAAKMFIGVDNIGVELSDEEFEQAQIEIGELGRVKPSISPLGPNMLRIYSDIDSYDIFERKEGNGNYIIRFKSTTVGGGSSLKLQWEQVSVGFKKSSPLSETDLALPDNAKKLGTGFKQIAKVNANTNGVRIITFDRIGVSA